MEKIVESILSALQRRALERYFPLRAGRWRTFRTEQADDLACLFRGCKEWYGRLEELRMEPLVINCLAKAVPYFEGGEHGTLVPTDKGKRAFRLLKDVGFYSIPESTYQGVKL